MKLRADQASPVGEQKVGVVANTKKREPSKSAKKKKKAKKEDWQT